MSRYSPSTPLALAVGTGLALVGCTPPAPAPTPAPTPPQPRTTAVAAPTTPHWDYGTEHGPASWASLSPEFATCASGKRQSPIDIVTANTTVELGTLRSAMSMTPSGLEGLGFEPPPYAAQKREPAVTERGQLPPELRALLEEGSYPGLICVYGTPDRILASGSGDGLLSGVPTLGMAGLLHSGPRMHPDPSNPVSSSG